MLTVLLRAKKRKRKCKFTIRWQNMEFSSSRGRIPETDPMLASSPRPHILVARSRGPRIIAVRAVFLGAVLTSVRALQSCTAVCRLVSEEQRALRSCACFVFSKAISLRCVELDI